MAAIITGNSLGLTNSSLATLGSRGALGSSQTGRAGESVFVDSVTGNLVLQNRDELLIGRGPDLGLVRTYNSQGLLNDDNADNWRMGVYKKVAGLTGTVNTAGSTVRRTDEDGAESVYTYDATLAAYVNKDGGGAFDTLSFNATTNVWTFTDGASQVKELYDNANGGRITQMQDTDGNSLTYTYNAAGLITQVTDASGESTFLDYTGTNLTQIRTVMGTTTLTRVRYAYDASNRLSTVTVDLSPADNSVADGRTYVTTYTYDGTSKRVVTLAQSDGTRLTFAYVQVGTAFKVSSITDALGQVTSLNYAGGAGQTTVNANPAALSTTVTTNTDFNLVAGALTTPVVAWSTAALRAGSSTTSATGVQTSFDQNGNGLAVWALGTSLSYSVYTKNNDSWSAAATLDGSLTGSPTKPNLSMSANGNALVTWVQNNNVYARRFIAGVWDGATTIPNLENLGGAAVNPVGAINNNGRAVVAFIQASGTTNNLYTNVFNGTAWAAAATVVDDIGTANANSITNTIVPSVAIDSLNNATALWLQRSGTQTADSLYFSRFTASTSTWSTPNSTTLENSTTAVTAESIAFDSNGNGIAIWLQGGSLFAKSYTRSTNAWSASTTLGTSASAPNLSMSANGNGLVTWVNANNILTRRYSAGAWVGSGATTIESATGAASSPSGSINDAGQAAVVFVQANGTTNNVLVNRFTGGAWQTATTIESNANSVAATMTPEVVIDAQGNLNAVWLQRNGTQTTDSVYSNHFNTSTTPYFTIPSGATWASVATAVYGSAAPAAQLQSALGNPPLTAGSRLSGFPATLTAPTTTTVAPYYTVQAGDTWSSIAQTVYGTAAAASALQAGMGDPALTAGLRLTVPSSLTLSGGGQATITDALGKATVVTFDGAGQLTGVIGPAVAGVSQQFSYAYNANGDVTQVTDAVGNVVSYGYDASGNQTLVRDAAGNTVTRTYGAKNELLTETVYVVPDPDGAGAGQPGSPLTTRYVYSATNHLRFMVSAEGRVTEYRYNGFGQRIAAIQYSGNLFTLTGLNPGDALTEAQLNTFVGTADKSKSLRVDTSYDFRGQVASTTTYAAVDAAGNGVVNGAESVRQSVYDQAGNLLTAVDPRGVATPAVPNDFTTSYVYDGLNRMLSSTDALGRVTLSQYDDANNKVVLTLANGLVSTSTFDATGHLVSVLQSANSIALGTTSYFYDADGRLRRSVDPTGISTHVLYDEAGRKVATIDGDGSLTEYRYNADNQLTKTIQYATAVSAANLASLIGAGGAPSTVTLAAIRPAASAQDRATWNAYDGANRLVKAVDELGFVTQNFYDGASRLTDGVRFATAISTAALTDTPTVASINPVSNASDRLTRNFYDGEGRLLGTLDGEGFLTEYKYDAAGELTETVGYATVTAAALRTTGTLAQLRPALNANDIHSYTLYNAKGQVVGVVDGEGFLTESVYDSVGNKTQSIRYATRVTFTPGASIAAIRPAADALDQITTATYTALNQVASETNPEGTLTQFTYDAVGNLTQTVLAVNTTDVRSLNAQYDKQGRLTAQLNGNGSALLTGSQTQAQIDAIWTANAIKYTYDAAGRRTSTTDANGNKTLFYYDADGRLTHSINALGEVKESRYNVLGQLTQTVAYGTRLGATTLATLSGGLVDATLTSAVAGIANATLDSARSTSYTLRGQVASSTDPLAFAINQIFNAFGEKVSASQQIGSGQTLDHTYAYDKRGLLTQTVWDPTGINSSESTVYDAFGRAIQSTDVNGNLRSQTYDRLGRVLTTVDPTNATRVATYDAFARVLTQRDALNTTTTFAYNNANRSVTMTTPEGIVVTTVHNRFGETQTFTDGRGGSTQYAYDRDGNLTQVTDALGQVSTRLYDKADRLTETVDARGTHVLYTYDAANRVLTRRFDPTGLNLSTTYAYDAKGQTTSVTDARGIVTQTQFDLKGEVTRVIVDPAGLNLRTAYAYDGRGKTLTVTEGEGSALPRVTQYTYDKLGRRTREQVDPAGLNLSTSYTYDKNGNVLTKTDPLNNLTRYVYDADNRLVYTIDPLGGVIETGYDAEDRIVKTVAYAAPISLTGLSATPTIAQVQPLVTAIANPAKDALARDVFDRDGRMVYTVSGLGPELVSMVSAVTQRVYDANGNVVDRIGYANAIPTSTAATSAAVSAAVALVADAAHDSRMRTVYDAANRATFTIDGTGAVTKFTYDANGNVIDRLSYATPVAPTTAATAAALTAAVVADAAHDSRVRMVYDAANRLVYVINGLGAVTENVYDADGNVIEAIQHSLPIVVSATPSIAEVSAALAQQSEPVSVTNQTSTLFANPTQPYTYSASAQNDVAAPATQTVAVSNTGQTSTLIQPFPYVASAKNDVASPASQNATLTTQGALGDLFPPRVTWPTSVQPAGTTVSFQFRRAGIGSYTNVAVVVSGANHQVSLSSQTEQGFYEYIIQYSDAFGRVLKSAAGVFRLAFAEALTSTATFNFTQVTSTAVAGSSISGYIPLAQVPTIDHISTTVTDSATGAVVSGNVLTYPEFEASYNGEVNLKVGSQLANGRYNVAVTVFYKNGTVENKPVFAYEVGPQSSILHTVSWAASTAPAGTTPSFAYRVQGSTGAFASAAVTTSGANHQVALNNITAGAYEYQVQYKDSFGRVLKSASSTFTVNGSGTTSTNTTFNFTQVTSTASAGSSITGYITAAEVPTIDFIDATVRDLAGNVVSTARTYPEFEPAYNGRVNLKVGSALPDGGKFNITVVIHKKDGTLDTRAAFYYEVGPQPFQARTTTISWQIPVGVAATTAQFTYAPVGSSNFTSAPVAQNGASQSVSLVNVPDGNYTYRVSYFNGTQLVRQASGTFASNAASTVSGQLQFQVDATRDGHTCWTYDAANRMVFSVDALGAVTQNFYDANGNLTQRIAYANRVNVELPATAAAVQAALVLDAVRDEVTRAAYDAAGRLVYSVDGLGFVTQSVYDAEGHLTRSVAFANAISLTGLGANPSAATIQSRLTANAALDRVEQSVLDADEHVIYKIDALGFVVKNDYDALGRVTRSTRFANAVPATTPATLAGVAAALTPNATTDRVDTFSYDAANRLTQSTDALGFSESYTYDALGNMLSFTNKKGSVCTYAYDAAGRAVTETTAVVEVNTISPTLVVTTAQASLVTGIQYDALGRVIARTEAQGRPEARTTRYAYDAAGHQVQTIFPPVNVYNAAADNLTTNGATGTIVRTETLATLSSTVTYDILGNAVVNRDVAGNFSYKVYDTVGRMRYEVDAERGVTEYVRDAFGNATQLIRYATALNFGTRDPALALTIADVQAMLVPQASADRRITTTYDALNRATQVVQPQAFNYDPDAAAGSQNFIAGATTKNAYNAFGQLVQVQTLKNASTNTFIITATNYYDQRGYQSATVNALGFLTTLAYDAEGNLVGQKEFAQKLASWTPASFGTPAASADDREIRYGYDRDNRKISQTQVNIEFSTAADGSSTRGDVTTTYGYDAVGNLTRTTDALGSSTFTYYDAIGRVKAVVAPQRTDEPDLLSVTPLSVFKLDAYGNAVQQTAYALGAAAGASETSFAIAGTSAADRTSLMRYDSFGDNIQYVDANNHSTFYSYDALGRVAKQWQPFTSNAGAAQNVVHVYQFDKVGRQVADLEPLAATALSAAAIVQHQTRYNAFGEMTARGINNGFQEYFDYDNAGRLWRTNTGDGVNKVSLYDLLGNSTADIRSATVDLKAGFTRPDDVAVLAGTVRTETRYDSLGRAIKRLQPTFLDSVTGLPVNPVINQAVDRWGNVTSVSDPRSATFVTQFRYNAFNQLIEQIQPDGNGAISAASPDTRLYYDKLGREIAAKDALGHINGRRLDAAGDVVEEIHADGGHVRYGYNAFGDRVKMVDARGNPTAYTYDRADNLLQTIHAPVTVNANDGSATLLGTQSLAETYAYDEANRRIRVINAAGGTTSYDYDARGNVIRTTMPMGQVTSAAYDLASNNKIAEVNANGDSASWGYSYFGILTAHTDIGGAVYTYAYNRLNNLTAQSNTRGQNIAYTYDAAGQLTNVNDIAIGQQTRFSYDAAGQRLTEVTVQGGQTYQNNHLAYDTLGRLALVDDGRYHLTLAYDNVGNRTHETVHYVNDSAAAVDHDFWFTYDAMNRETIVEGVNTAGVIGINASQGHQLAYDLNGNRISDHYFGSAPVQTGVDESGNPVYGLTQTFVTRNYAYDANDRLTVEDQDGLVLDQRSYDQANRLVRSGPGAGPQAIFDAFREGVQIEFDTYDANNRQVHQRATGVDGSPRYDSSFTSYDGMGNLLTHSVAVQTGTAHTNTYTSTYAKFDGVYREASQSATSTVLQPGITTETYDQNGNLIAVTDSTLATNNRTFVNDVSGRVLQKTQNSRNQHFLIVNGQVMGNSGDSAAAEGFKAGGQGAIASAFLPLLENSGLLGGGASSEGFSLSYSQIGTPGTLAPTPGTYTVMPRDTLQSVARSVWGDASLWYLIADANGLDGNARLTVGQQLVIPARVNGANNNVGVFRPYDALRTIGDTTPNLPAPPPQPAHGGGGGCGIIGTIIVAIVAIVVTIFLTPIVTAALAPVLGGTGAAIIGAGVAAAAGNIAGQVVGNVVGIQNGFDWKAVAVAGLTAGITQGITGPAGLALGSAPTDVALKAAINTAVNQGLRVAVGLQSSFNWRMVAASALGAFAGAVVSDAIGAAQYGDEFKSLSQNEPWKLSQDFGNNFAREFGSGLVRNVVTTVASGGKLNAVNLVGDVFGNALGQSIGSYLVAPGQQQEAMRQAQEQAEAEARRAELIGRAAYERQAAFEREVSDNIDREDAELGRAMLARMRQAEFERQVSENIDREDAELGAAMLANANAQATAPTGQGYSPMANALLLAGTTLDWNAAAPVPYLNPFGVPMGYFRSTSTADTELPTSVSLPSDTESRVLSGQTMLDFGDPYAVGANPGDQLAWTSRPALGERGTIDDYVNYFGYRVYNVHAIASQRAITQISPDFAEADLRTIDRAQQMMDAPENQVPARSFLHAMRDGTTAQTIEQAQALADAFVRERYQAAWDAMQNGDRDRAMFEFGQALHTLQDNTSPAHEGFQAWNAPGYYGGFQHINQERTYPGDNSNLFRTTQQAYQWFAAGRLPDGNLFVRR